SDRQPERRQRPQPRRALARDRGQALLALDDVPASALAEHAVGGQRLRPARRARPVDRFALGGEVELFGTRERGHQVLPFGPTTPGRSRFSAAAESASLIWSRP